MYENVVQLNVSLQIFKTLQIHKMLPVPFIFFIFLLTWGWIGNFFFLVNVLILKKYIIFSMDSTVRSQSYLDTTTVHNGHYIIRWLITLKKLKLTAKQRAEAS